MKNINQSKEMTENKKNKIKRMSQKATQTITAIQTSDTMSQASKRLGITRSALYERIQRYGLMGIIDEIRKQAETTIVMASNDVADELVSVAKGDKKVTRNELSAKQDLLDRAGVTKKENSGNINIASKDMSITFEQM